VNLSKYNGKPMVRNIAFSEQDWHVNRDQKLPLDQPRKLKILLSAFACHPEKGSEEGVAWNWLKVLSQEHQVYVFISTLLGQDEAVKAAVAKLPSRENIHLTIIPLSDRRHRLFSLLPILEFYVHCVEWQQSALRAAQTLVRETDIDIVHHVTYATWTVPSFLWRLPQPFVLGPVAGGQRTPLVGYQFMPLKGIIQEIVRMVFYFWARLPLRAAKETVKRSDLVLCGNFETLQEVRSMRHSSSSLFMSEVGINQIPDVPPIGKFADAPGTSDAASTVSLLWVAAFEHRKNFGLLLSALQMLPPDIQWQLFVAGEGTCLAYWQKRVVELGLDHKIQFLGQVPYHGIAAYYQKVDMFVFPSLREGSATVMIEAMANGLPVIALKLCGMASLLSDDCGILVNVESKRQMIRDFAVAIEQLARDRDLRHRVGQNAYVRIRDHYTWEYRAKRMLSLYEGLLLERQNN
jgi:glycosyltransferase involved in cell wall biosynthesis